MRRLFAVLIALAAVATAQTLKSERTIALPDGVKVRSTILSPKTGTLAALGSDNKLRIYDNASGKLLQTLDLGGEKISRAEFSRDGHLLAAGGRAGSVRVWDASSGKLKLEFKTTASVEAVAISPDAQLAAVAPLDHSVEIWDIAAGKRLALLTAPFAGTSELAFSPDSSSIATADADTGIRIYDARSGKLRVAADDMLLEAFAIVYSPDGKFLLAGGADKTISVIDTSTGKITGTFPRQKWVLVHLAPSADGRSVAAAYFDEDNPDKTMPMIVWDVASRTEKGRVFQESVEPNGCTYAADGALQITSATDKELTLWSVH